MSADGGGRLPGAISGSMQFCARSRWSSPGSSPGAAAKAPSNKTPQQMGIQTRIGWKEDEQLLRIEDEGPPRKVEKIAPLRTIEPCGINAVAEDEWVEIEVAVNS